MAELFPARVRSVGLSLAYNVAVMIFGGFAQFIVTWLIKSTGSSMAPAYYVMFGVALGLVASLHARPRARQPGPLGSVRRRAAVLPPSLPGGGTCRSAPDGRRHALTSARASSARVSDSPPRTSTVNTMCASDCRLCVFTPTTFRRSRANTSDRSRSRPERSRAHADVHRIERVRGLAPGHLDDAFRLALGQRQVAVTIATMDGHAAASGDKAGDGVRRRRAAAARQLRQQRTHAHHQHPALAAFSALSALAPRRAAVRALRPARAAGTRVDLPQAEFFLGRRHVQVVGAGKAQVLGQLLQVDGGLAQALQFLSTSACPCVMRCCSSMALNHMRTLERARGLARKPSCGLSQSRDGPPDLAEMISTVCPVDNRVCSGTIWPSTRAPRQRCPRSVCR